MAAIQFLAEQGDAGKTVAEMLRRRFQLTWKQAKSLVDGGHIRIAGMGCTDAAQRIRRGNRVWIREGVVEKKPGIVVPRMPKKPGDKAEVKTAKPTPKEVQKPAAKRAQPVVVPTGLDLIYSDDDIAVVNKPAGLTTMRHAEEAAEFGERGQTYLPKTVADFVPHMLGRPQARVIAVHRIDQGTSGLVVFARNPAAAKSLTEQFKKHTVDRRYLALVRCGAPKSGRVESTLIPDRGDGRRGSAAAGVETEDGKRAVTNIKVVEELGVFAAVECRLETGRTHQVRIHLGEAGHPLCGEKIYDRPIHGKPLPDGSGALRPMLHAVRLGLKHPTSHETMTWEEAPPADFASLWRKMRAVAKTAVV